MTASIHSSRCGTAVLLAALALPFGLSVPVDTASAQPVFQPRAASSSQARPPRPQGPRLGPRFRSAIIEDNPPTTQSAPQPPAPPVSTPQPPAPAPTGETTARPRDLGEDFMLEVLAPEEAGEIVGYVSTPNPSVFWFLRGGDAKTVTFSVREGDSDTPSGEVSVPPAPGYRVTQFSAAGVPALETGTVYVWTVDATLSDDSVASVSSEIEYVPFNNGEDPAAECGADNVCAASKLAEEGYWYDALARLSPNGAPPANGPARELWDQLLNDVGLDLP